MLVSSNALTWFQIQAETDVYETASTASRRSNAMHSEDTLPVTRRSTSASVQPTFSEYHFGMCVAQMFEEVPKVKRARLKANIFGIFAKELDPY